MSSPTENRRLLSSRVIIASASVGVLLTAAAGVYVNVNDILFGHPPWAIVIFFPGIVAGNVVYESCGASVDFAVGTGCVAVGVVYALATLLIAALLGKRRAK